MVAGNAGVPSEMEPPWLYPMRFGVWQRRPLVTESGSYADFAGARSRDRSGGSEVDTAYTTAPSPRSGLKTHNFGLKTHYFRFYKFAICVSLVGQTNLTTLDSGRHSI